MLIKNGKLVLPDGTAKMGSLLIDGTKIKSVSFDDIEYNGEIIDAQGRYVTPGFIEPHCHAGIHEQSIGFEGNDTNEMTSPSTPHMRGIDAVYPQDTAFKDSLEEGFTAVSTGPGSANIIGGTFSVIKTRGKSIEEMIVKEDIAMKMALGENPKRVYGHKDKSPATRMASAAILREELSKAKRYYDKRRAGKDYDYDQKLDALSKVFDGLICKIHAHRSDDIQTAIRIAKEFNLNVTIEHCSEGHLVVNDLKRNSIPAIIGPTMMSRTKYESRNKTLITPKILEENNVEFAIMTDHPVIPIFAARAQIGLMIREGLSLEGAFKAVTSNAAKLNNVDDRIGKLEEGLDADVVIWNDMPFNIFAKPDYVIIDGKLEFKGEEL